jgi:hypothetical protein
MTRAAVVVFSFWLVLAFVTWNVIFDRHVSVAAVAFTREQTGNHLAGRPLVSIDDGFTPQVQAAAARASRWAGAIVALGAFAAWRAGRSVRSRSSSRPQ